jgi:CheY-like chemotaxis protein
MMNLVINASEAMVDGLGIVTVRSGVWDPPEQSTAATGELEFEKENYVFIEVSDTGRGIPRSDLDRICEPFYSTKFTGRGLGLSVVSGIVRSHRGAMEIESDIGKGTTFRIILPAADQPPTPMKNENENSSVGSIDDASSQTILVVDDEENVRTTMRVLLEFYKYNVLTAPNGETAIDTVQAFDGQISLVLLDLTMPGIGAPEIVAKIGAIQPGIPVVLMSGYSRDDVADQMKELGAAAFLPKPSTAVRSTVREVLQRQHVKPTNS